MIGPLMQVTLRSPQSTFSAVVNVGLALVYFVCSIAQVIEALKSQKQPLAIATRITQTLFAPMLLLLGGGIILLNGWRLDPILVFNQFIMQILVAYLAALDIRRIIRRSSIKTKHRS